MINKEFAVGRIAFASSVFKDGFAGRCGYIASMTEKQLNIEGLDGTFFKILKRTCPVVCDTLVEVKQIQDFELRTSRDRQALLSKQQEEWSQMFTKEPPCAE